MSSRDKNLNHLIDTIGSILTPKIGKVSDKPVEFAKLARTAFPFIAINIDSEDREDITMQHRLCTMYVGITAHIQAAAKGNEANSQLNVIMEAIDKALEKDRTRGGNALLTELREVNTIEESNFPIVSLKHIYVIQYYHNRGNS
jgi:hypothetical protein